MASPTGRVDSTLIKWVFGYLVIIISAIFLAEIVSDGDSSPLVTQIISVATPIGALLILGAKGGEVVQQNLNQTTRIEEKTDEQTARIENIEHAVNGKLDSRFNALGQEQATLRSEVTDIKTDLAEICEMMKLITAK